MFHASQHCRSLHWRAGFPGGALVPDLVNQSQQLFASHQGDSLNQLASVAVDHPMASEGLVDASAGMATGRMTQTHLVPVSMRTAVVLICTSCTCLLLSSWLTK